MSRSISAAAGLLLAAILILPAAHAAEFDDTGEPVLGPVGAPVRVLFFYDFQCPHCARTAPVLMGVVRQYGDLVRLVAVNVPSPGHPLAEPAAEFALTSMDAGKFWPAFDALFANQSRLSGELFAALGKELGLDPKRVAANLEGHAHRDRLKSDFYRAIDLGINATPTVFVGDVELVGFHDADAFRYAINEALKANGVRSPVPDVARPAEKAPVAAGVPEKMIYPVHVMAPVDSKRKVNVGDKAPDFTLPTIAGKEVRLSAYRGARNVVLSFVPAAWTPVCSAQWPEYNENKAVFEKADAVVIGISVDNLPTLYAWTGEMGPLWFPVASDFYPHGAAAQKYGILRGGGVTERAVILIDKAGIIRYIDVHDINTKPDFDTLRAELAKLTVK